VRARQARSRITIGCVVIVALASGCTKANPAAPSAASSVAGSTDVTADVAFCVDEVNRLRGTLGLSALRHSDAVDGFATEASRVDGEAHQAHKYFYDTNGGSGLSLAENEILWWPAAIFSSTQAIIAKGLAMEFAEGPGGDHYDNMTNAYAEIGCGISLRNGEVTVTQDFR